MTEGELKKYLEAAEKNPKQIAAAVSGLPEKVLRYKPAPDEPTPTHDCPHCLSSIPEVATVCAFCTRDVAAVA